MRCCTCAQQASREGLGNLPFCTNCYRKYMFAPKDLVQNGGYKHYFLREQPLTSVVKNLLGI